MLQKDIAIYKTKGFTRWADQEGVADSVLYAAVEALRNGGGNALGGHVHKIRVALGSRGKSGGARTLIAYKENHHVFFVYGFAKNQQSNIGPKELKALKKLAKELLGYTDRGISKAVACGELYEVKDG